MPMMYANIGGPTVCIFEWNALHPKCSVFNDTLACLHAE